ncbi:hypothetical protein MRB53_001126 [Persea americana]|uniref:Uncharacterized protein n=1 Tax=Persea americana TaxID=3435 RepID=A0ACC2MRT0_PERAE|nr:hypothetical protein MRB53_001126 [Persea americana]
MRSRNFVVILFFSSSLCFQINGDISCCASPLMLGKEERRRIRGGEEVFPFIDERKEEKVVVGGYGKDPWHATESFPCKWIEMKATNGQLDPEPYWPRTHS